MTRALATAFFAATIIAGYALGAGCSSHADDARARCIIATGRIPH